MDLRSLPHPHARFHASTFIWRAMAASALQFLLQTLQLRDLKLCAITVISSYWFSFSLLSFHVLSVLLLWVVFIFLFFSFIVLLSMRFVFDLAVFLFLFSIFIYSFLMSLFVFSCGDKITAFCWRSGRRPRNWKFAQTCTRICICCYLRKTLWAWRYRPPTVPAAAIVSP